MREERESGVSNGVCPFAAPRQRTNCPNDQDEEDNKHRRRASRTRKEREREGIAASSLYNEPTPKERRRRGGEKKAETKGQNEKEIEKISESVKVSLAPDFLPVLLLLLLLFFIFIIIITITIIIVPRFLCAADNRVHSARLLVALQELDHPELEDERNNTLPESHIAPPSPSE